MNLKEAFRTQNVLTELMTEGELLLGRDENIVRVENTCLRKKVMPEAENETTVQATGTELADRITDVARFLLFLLEEREKLSRAIRTAKNGLPIDMDSETSLNAKRQSLARLFRHMSGVRNSEVLISDGGVGYRFNQEGNQVPYRCDVRRVTTINFDRCAIRSFAAGMSRKADSISSELDRCLVNTDVAYKPPFDLNDSFTEVFETFIRVRNAENLL